MIVFGFLHLIFKFKKAQVLSSWHLKLGIEPGLDDESVLYLKDSIVACCYIVDPYVLFLTL